MGVCTPFVGYRTLSHGKYKNDNIKNDKKSINSLDKFKKIFTNSSLAEILLSEYGFLHNPRVLDPRCWFIDQYEEKDFDNRTVLKKMTENQKGNFTIVVPDLEHITEGNINSVVSLQRIVNKNIPVISAARAVEIYDRAYAKYHSAYNLSYVDWIGDIKRMYMDDEKSLIRSLEGRLKSPKYIGEREKIEVSDIINCRIRSMLVITQGVQVGTGQGARLGADAWALRRVQEPDSLSA